MSPESATPAEELIRAQIGREGPLTFAAFLEVALYHPEVGYYSQPSPVLGAEGDYFTSPLLHPAFAACLGGQALEVWWRLGRPDPFILHEAGPGTGLLARDLLRWASAAAPDFLQALTYRLDERSEALRARQRETLADTPPQARVEWVNGFQPDAPVRFVLANELLDALPFHLLTVEGGQLRELYVTIESDRLTFVPGALSTPRLAAYFTRLGLRPPEGARVEVSLAALDWLASAARALGSGLLLVFDYGHAAEQLYGAGRRHGTLLSYYRHTLGSDPLTRVGRQDITAHVDFTSVRQAGEAAGLETLGLVSQARFLRNLGLEAYAARLRAFPLPQRELSYNLRSTAALTDVEGLGRIGVLCQTRALPGFAPRGLVGSAGLASEQTPDIAGAAAPLPLMDARHLRLPDPAGLDLADDFEAMWQEAWGGDES